MPTNLYSDADGNGVQKALKDEVGDAMLAKGVTVPSDTSSGFAKGCLFMDTDAAATAVLYLNEGTSSSSDFNVINPGATSATAYDDIGDPDANSTIAFAGFTNTWTSTLDTGSMFTISNTDAALAGQTNIVDLKFTDDGEANGIYLRCLDNSGADVKFTIGADGATIIAGATSGTDALTLIAGDITLTDGVMNLTTGGVAINSDNINLTLGASDATDSKIFFDGAGNLTFFDSNLGVNVTLSNLAAANPVGDFTISDGQFAWTDTTDEVAGTWSFAGTTNNDINITSAVTTGFSLNIIADAITSGGGLRIESSASGITSGKYITCFDGSANDFTVGANGATIIAGSAAADALTITAGDIQITAGDINLDDGILSVDNDADEGNNITRNFNGAGTAAVLTVQSAHASGTNNALFIDQDGTGAAPAMLIDSEGTADTLTIQSLAAGASLIKATGEAVTGTILESISAASATVSAATFTDTGTGATGWLGADGVGQVQITCDGDLAHANASCLLIEYSGGGAATGLGTSLRITDTGTTATSWAAYISAGTGEALFVDSGTVRFDEQLQLGAADGTGADLIAYGATVGDILQWDESADTLFVGGTATLEIGGIAGATDGVTFNFDGATLDIDAVTANDDINFGSNVDTDVIFTTAGSSATIDHGDNTITLAADMQLIVTGNTTSGNGLVIPNHASNTPNGSVGGSIFFEQDAKKLWIYDANSAGWVGVTLA